MNSELFNCTENITLCCALIQNQSTNIVVFSKLWYNYVNVSLVCEYIE